MTTAASAASGGGVLVVDDERHIVLLLEVNLQRQGHAVAKAFNLAEAKERLAHATFALMVIDAPMPDGDVHAFLRETRADPRHAGMRIVVMAKSDDGSGPPADACLTKPFNPQLLLGFL
ncbi:hypothetical protein BH11ARM2_BH11ARM2_35010 [soil metagenome]